MKNADLSRELINILDQTTTMIRQDLVTIRNDMMVNKLGLTKVEVQVQAIRVELDSRAEERKIDIGNRTKLIVGIGGAIIAASSALVVALIEFFKK